MTLVSLLTVDVEKETDKRATNAICRNSYLSRRNIAYGKNAIPHEAVDIDPQQNTIGIAGMIDKAA